MALENNRYTNIINAKRNVAIVGELFEALTTPITNDIVRYNNASFNIKTGLFRYGNLKPIMLSKNRRTFPIVALLMDNGGNEVTYDSFAIVLKSKNTLKFRESVKSTIRDLRRRLGINAKNHPERNIFIPTGNGFILHAQ